MSSKEKKEPKKVPQASKQSTSIKESISKLETIITLEKSNNNQVAVQLAQRVKKALEKMLENK